MTHQRLVLVPMTDVEVGPSVLFDDVLIARIHASEN